MARLLNRAWILIMNNFYRIILMNICVNYRIVLRDTAMNHCIALMDVDHE